MELATLNIKLDSSVNDFIVERYFRFRRQQKQIINGLKSFDERQQRTFGVDWRLTWSQDKGNLAKRWKQQDQGTIIQD